MQHVMTKPVTKDIMYLNARQILLPEEDYQLTGEDLSSEDTSDLYFIPINNYLDLLVVTALR